jgi:hypothetical protein
MRVLLVFLALVALQQELPPPFPRAGTTLMLENERVRVWNIAWLKQAYPQHRHPYDMTGVYYTTGDRIIISPEGERRESHTEAWNITFQRTGLTHAEEGASDEPLRSVFIEMKQPPGGSATAAPGEAAFPAGGATQRLDNDRVAVWELGAAVTPRSAHRHVREAVVVWFDAAGAPLARYVERGAVDDADAPPGAARTFVFEIK